MKFLILNYEYPPLGGGAGVMTQNIAQGLAKLDHQVTVITTWYQGLDTEQKKKNLHIIRLKSRRKLIYRSNACEMLSWIRHGIRFLNSFCSKNAFDFCLANFSLPGGWVAYHLKKKFHLPYAVISHGHDIPWFFPKQMFWYHLFTYFFIKKICLQSAVNIMLTDKMKKNIDKFLGEKNIDKNIIIPNGCNTSFFVPDPAKKTFIYTLIFIGRLVPQKNPMIFLKALKILHNNNIPFQAKIIGDGSLRKKLQCFAEKNLPENKVVFTGWKTQEELLKEYQSAHVLVQTSRYEAMSIAPLEAICCGTFVVCTPAGANNEVVTNGKTGKIFYPNKPKLLSEILFDFYQHYFLKNFFIDIESVQNTRKKYNMDAIIEKYLNIVENYRKNN